MGGASAWAWSKWLALCSEATCYTICSGSDIKEDELMGDSCDEPFRVAGSTLASEGTVHARGDYGAGIEDDLLCVAHKAQWNRGWGRCYGVGCSCEFNSWWRSRADAWARARVIDHTGPVVLSVKLNVERASTEDDPTAYRGMVQFYTVTVVWKYPDRMEEVIVYQGVAGLLDEAATATALGFLDSPDYETTVNGNTVHV